MKRAKIGDIIESLYRSILRRVAALLQRWTTGTENSSVKQLSESTPSTWSIAKSTIGDRTIIFRYVSNRAAHTRRVQQRERVFIVWRFESETGMPTPQDAQRMRDLEDVLDPHVVNDGFATLAIVATGDGLREWTYYADSGAEFVARLNVALSSLSSFPIEIHEAIDPDWQYYTEFLASLKGEANTRDE